MNRKAFDSKQIHDLVEKAAQTTFKPSISHLHNRLLRNMELFLLVDEQQAQADVCTAARNKFILFCSNVKRDSGSPFESI